MVPLHPQPPRARSAAAAVALCLLLFAGEALAQPVTPGSAAATAGTRSRWAGSVLTYRNVANAIGLQKDVEPTWEPMYAMSLVAAPRFRIAKGLGIAVLAQATREITDNDWTTERGEIWLADTFATLNMSAPRLDLLATTVGAHLRLRLPTSKASLARTMRVGTFVGVNTTTAGSFDLFGLKQTLALQLIGRLGYLWHRYTEASLDEPWLGGCADLPGGCMRYSHSGLRNTEWQTQLMGAFNWQLHPTFGLAVQAGAFLDRLHPLADATTSAGAIAVPVDPTDPNTRGLAFYVIAATWQPISTLAVSFGSETVHNQLRPDSTYRRPFFNRSTTLFVGLSLFPSALFAGS